MKKCINIDKICIECYDFQQVKALFGVKSAFRCLFINNENYKRKER